MFVGSCICTMSCNNDEIRVVVMLFVIVFEKAKIL